MKVAECRGCKLLQGCPTYWYRCKSGRGLRSLKTCPPCSECGGRGTVEIVNVVTAWGRCPACHGTGTARREKQ